MSFILQMAKRETRASWRRLLFFFICIAIGVGAIVAVRSIIRNFHSVFVTDARAILAADVQLDSNHPWSAETTSKINSVLDKFHVDGRVQTIEASTMLRPADEKTEGAMMVEIKGIESPFPFY